MRATKRREGTEIRSLFLEKPYHAAGVRDSVDCVCSNRHGVRLGSIQCRLGFHAAPPKFEANRVARSPNLIEKVGIAQEVQQEDGVFCAPAAPPVPPPTQNEE